jgi:Tol biopolymer transport system component
MPPAREEPWAAEPSGRRGLAVPVAAIAVLGALAAVVSVVYGRREPPRSDHERTLTRLTFAPGLQTDPTWSPDGRFIAYSSDQSGNFDLWVQPVGGGDAVQVTEDSAHDWQPEWSPDGSSIVFRSERDGGGVYVVAALGGQERRIASFGFQPRWSPDGTQILFTTTLLPTFGPPRLFTVTLDGAAPREVLRAFLAQFEAHGFSPGTPASVTWHPDGRVSFWGWHREQGESFWTVGLDGTVAVRSQMATEVERRFGQLRLGKDGERVRWSRSGRALYLSGSSLFGSTQVNLWKLEVDPETLRWTGGPHRLTTGPGEDETLAVSPDGSELAFTTRTTLQRIVSFPLDHRTRRFIDEPRAHTPAELPAAAPDVTTDGHHLAFMMNRSAGRGSFEIRTKSLLDGRETLVSSWAPLGFRQMRIGPRWSPDATRLAYMFWPSVGEDRRRVVVADARTGTEQAVTSLLPEAHPFHWSSDAQWILASLKKSVDDPLGIWALPLAGAPEAEKKARLLAADPRYELWQPRFSPGDRWVVFNAVTGPEASTSTVYVVPASGGPWRQVSDGRDWDDKPRWSPDGKTIYFLSARDGVFNVWAVAFDPERGSVEGEPTRVTAFTGPGRMLTPNLPIGDMAVSESRLFVCLQEVSGAVWTLDQAP